MFERSLASPPFRLFALCSFPHRPLPSLSFSLFIHSTVPVPVRSVETQSRDWKEEGRGFAHSASLLLLTACTLHCIYIHIRFAFVASNTNIEGRDRGMCRERQRDSRLTAGLQAGGGCKAEADWAGDGLSYPCTVLYTGLAN